jgi:hypothetical protein
MGGNNGDMAQESAPKASKLYRAKALAIIDGKSPHHPSVYPSGTAELYLPEGGREETEIHNGLDLEIYPGDMVLVEDVAGDLVIRKILPRPDGKDDV